MKNFTRVTALVAGVLLTAGAAMAQTAVTSVGLVGLASPAASWDISNGANALSQTTSTSHIWVGTKTMTAGEFKFRANNAWDINWGAPTTGSAFPNTAGAPGAPGGSNIVATAGRYFVTINDQTGAYTFTAVSATATREAGAARLGLTVAPNPTNEAAIVAYELPAAANVSLTLYNSLGQVARQLPATRQNAGLQAQDIAHLGLAPGIYVVSLQANDLIQTTRLVVQ